MTRKRRLLLSLAGGVLLPLLALIGAFLGAALADLWKIEWVGKAFLWMIGWPLQVLHPVTPNSEDTSVTARNIRMAVLIAVPILDMLAYSVLTYLFLCWLGKGKQPSAPN